MLEQILIDGVADYGIQGIMLFLIYRFASNGTRSLKEAIDNNTKSVEALREMVVYALVKSKE
jgi:hypothetical protein